MPSARVCLFALFAWGTAALPAAAQLSPEEVYRIIRTVYDQEGFDITGRSSRQQLNAFLTRAVGVVHFGHPVYNPSPDPRWCVKNGGPGRPMSDDVVARCDTRDAWDLIGGIGGPNPYWAPTYIGRLPSIQNIYPPTRPEPYVGHPMTLAGTMQRPRVTLSWTPAAIGPSSVSYTLDVRGPVTMRVPVGAQTGLAADAPDGVYTFVVEAAYATGILVRSNTATVPVGIFALPGPPLGLTARANGSLVTFEWQLPAVDGGAPVQAFVLEAGSAPGLSDLAVLTLGGGTTFTTPPVPDGSYFVRVRARSIAGAGAPSTEVRAVVGPPPPAAPVLTGASSGGSVSLGWNVPSSGAAPTGYRVFVGSQPGASDVADIATAATSLDAAGVPPGTYFVRVAATSAHGLGFHSNELTLVVP